jgi:hypothetical protein
MALFLSAMGYLILALMAISSPIICLILGAIGIIIMGLMKLLMVGSIIGSASVMIWLLAAIGVLAWKFQNRG